MSPTGEAGAANLPNRLASALPGWTTLIICAAICIVGNIAIWRTL